MNMKLFLIILFLILAGPIFFVVWLGIGIMFPQVNDNFWSHLWVFLTWFFTITSINRSSR